MTQTGVQATARTAGSLGQRIFDVLARTFTHPAASGRGSPERRSSGPLSAEILRTMGASHAYRDYADDREAGSERRLFNIADSIRMGLPHR